MPVLAKLLFAIWILWTLVYSASFCADQYKNKNLKGALTVAVLSLILVLTFGLSMMPK